MDDEQRLRKASEITEILTRLIDSINSWACLSETRALDLATSIAPFLAGVSVGFGGAVKLKGEELDAFYESGRAAMADHDYLLDAGIDVGKAVTQLRDKLILHDPATCESCEKYKGSDFTPGGPAEAA